MAFRQSVDRDDALALHRAGRIGEAMAAYQALLEVRPGDGDLLGLLGVASEQIGDVEGAERLLRRGLTDTRFAPATYRNLNNLLGLLIETGRENEAREITSQFAPPPWPDDAPFDGVERDTILSLLAALKLLGRVEVAAIMAGQFHARLGQDIDFALISAELTHLLGDSAGASQLLDRDFGMDEGRPNLHILRASLAYDRQDLKGCSEATKSFAAALPTLLSEHQPSQRFTLAVFNKAPEYIRNFTEPFSLHYSGNFPSQLARTFADRFRFMSVFVDSPEAAAAMSEMPRPALALNNFVNAEQLMTDNAVGLACEIEDSLGIPVINHPRLAVQATRQKNSERFIDHPDIIFPTLSRYLNSKHLRGLLMDEIESSYEYPLILRTVYQQMGAGTWLIENRKELNDRLDNLNDDQIYIIKYISRRHENGFYRSMRAAFVDNRPVLIRADYSDNWNVRARYDPARQEFYRGHPALLSYANHIVMEPEDELGQSALDKLQQVADKMPLNIFGMDFDIADDGKLLIFEANATMNLLSTSPDGFHYPKEIEDRLLIELDEYFCRSAQQR